MNPKEEVENEMMQQLAERFMPLADKAIPLIHKKLLKSRDFLEDNEYILIGRGSDRDFVILKYKKDDIDVNNHKNNTDIHLEKTKIFTFDNLMSMLLGSKGK